MNQTERKKIMNRIYAALLERGYRPMDQIIGYILTDDPSYITNHNGARRMIADIDQHDLVHDMLMGFFSSEDMRSRGTPVEWTKADPK